jgi:ADP-ribose pyrophosphatase
MPGAEWEQLASEPAFEDPHLPVRRDTIRLPSGRIVDDYLVATLGDYALVVALTRAGDVVLVRQWKQGVRRTTLELPGGTIDPGEAPEKAAGRELREETGYEAPALTRLAALDVDASKATTRGHVFLGTGAQRLHETEPHEMEEPDVVLVPPSHISGLIESGEIAGAASVAGLLLALARID